MKKWVTLASLFLAATLALAAVPAPTAWPVEFNASTVGPIADYLNEPILAARAAYNVRLAEKGKTKITTEQGWDGVYLPKYPRDGWLRYSGIPPYQIIGPNCVGGFGLHEFQGHQEIWARVNEMGGLCLRGHPTSTTTSIPAATPATVATATPSPSSGCVDQTLGIPGPFGQCFTCAGVPVVGVENRSGTCVRAATVTPKPPILTPAPVATAPPCVETRYGRPGPFGQCYTCTGSVVSDAVIGSGGICGPPRVAPTHTPVLSATAVPTEVPTVAPTPPVEATSPPTETPQPPSGKKGCGGTGGVLAGTLAALAGLAAWKARRSK